jgi:DNA-binding phage protein
MQILSANLESLIGEGRRFRNDAEMGERTGLGQRKIHRLRNQAGEPKFDNLDVLSERLHVPIPALLSPNMDVMQGAVPDSVADIVRRICALAYKNALEQHDLMHLSSAVSLIEKSKGIVTLSSESNKRGTGT